MGEGHSLSSCWWHCQGSSTVQSFESLRCATRDRQTLVKMSIAGRRSNSTCRCYCRVLICTVGNGFYKLSEIVSCKLNGSFPLKHVLFNVRLQESDYDLVKIWNSRTRPKASWWSLDTVWNCLVCCRKIKRFCSWISAYDEWVSYRMGVSKLQATGMFMKSLAVHSASHQVSWLVFSWCTYYMHMHNPWSLSILKTVLGRTAKHQKCFSQPSKIIRSCVS